MHICTIVARNYLAAARVLARSFTAHNEGGTCWTLVIDDVDHEISGEDEPFEVVRPEELAIAQWDQMAAGYRGVKFDDKGQNTLASSIVTQMKGGQYVPVWPKANATEQRLSSD